MTPKPTPNAIEHDGGPCPVAPETRVRVWFRGVFVPVCDAFDAAFWNGPVSHWTWTETNKEATDILFYEPLDAPVAETVVVHGDERDKYMVWFAGQTRAWQQQWVGESLAMWMAWEARASLSTAPAAPVAGEDAPPPSRREIALEGQLRAFVVVARDLVMGMTTLGIVNKLPGPHERLSRAIDHVEAVFASDRYASTPTARETALEEAIAALENIHIKVNRDPDGPYEEWMNEGVKRCIQRLRALSKFPPPDTRPMMTHADEALASASCQPRDAAPQPVTVDDGIATNILDALRANDIMVKNIMKCGDNCAVCTFEVGYLSEMNDQILGKPEDRK